MTVLIEREQPIAVVRLNRPEQLNALSNQLMSELVGALENLDDDDAVSCIVLAGDEKAFASGITSRTLAFGDFVSSGSSRRIQESTKSCATTGPTTSNFPPGRFAHFASARSVKRHSRPSGETVHFSATPGTTAPDSGSMRVSPSRHARHTRSSTGVEISAGSNA